MATNLLPKKGTDILKKENISEIKSDKKLSAEKKKYFIGMVKLHEISRIIQTKEQKIYYVTFYIGARTKLHFHEAGQILITTEGTGILELYERKGIVGEKMKIKKLEKFLLKKGDLIYIPPHVIHWHGCRDKKAFSHIAINSYTMSGKEAKTIWFDSDFKTIAEKIQ